MPSAKLAPIMSVKQFSTIRCFALSENIILQLISIMIHLRRNSAVAMHYITFDGK